VKDIMREVEVNKLDLLVKLKENKAKHISEHKEARKVYNEKLIEWAEQLILDTKANREVIPWFKEDVPTSFEEEYKLAIDMLEWSTETDTVLLTQNEFKQYVNDEWNWSQGFKATNSKYGVQ
jgi:hypothetical protein